MPITTSPSKVINRFLYTKEEIYQVGSYPEDVARLSKQTTISRSGGRKQKAISKFYLGGKVVKYKGTYKPEFVTPGFFDLIQNNNPFSFADTNREEFLKLVIGREVESVEEDWRIIWQNSSDHTFLNSDLDPLPYARHYDYAGSPFNDAHLNLNEEFLDFLRGHPWVVNKSDLQIQSVPYYVEGHMRTFVNVLVKPDEETYKEMWEFYNSSPKHRFPGVAVHEAMTGYYHLFSRKEKDWFGISPFLRNP